jgi:formate dehydrogenase iron-sulfur subunit
MATVAPKGPIRTTLVDVNNCIGCKACQVACKQWNDREGESTELLVQLGFQNPPALSAKTYTLISAHEIPDDAAPGGLRYTFAMRRCFHCLEPACVSACPTTALFRQEDGPVVYSAEKCIGCRYCMLACPWDVPTAEWDSLAPKIQKCTHCADRTDQPLPLARNGQALSPHETELFKETMAVPACVKACPADALVYGEREEMLKEARRRIAARPDRYVDHIYGEKEAGGTSVLYVSNVPFEKLGFPDVGNKSYPGFSKPALTAVPPAVMAVGAMLGAAYVFFKQRVHAVAGEAGSAQVDHHMEFERLTNKLKTPFNMLMLLLVAFCGVSLVARFARGLGGSTHLSDTFPWGLWIVFDLIWIAVAAGAFAMAGVIYVFQRKDLYGLGRTAVLMGLLSYSFVMVTLLADLGLPWHFYQLGIQAPEHSAMFEVSWCVGLYVTILALEFLPNVLERRGNTRALAAWRKWSGAYVALAITLFVWMLSRNLVYAAVTFAIFGTLAWLFRARDSHAEPIMLAIAAVTLSMMHQSSLGSLYLLVPNMLAPQWWSQVMPVNFFLSSIVAGTALVVLINMWIARAWHRPLDMKPLAAVGQLAFWSMLVYLVFRLGDMALQGQLATAFSGKYGLPFAAEIILGGIVPLVLLSTRSLRMRRGVLFAATLLAVLGVVYNRTNVVLFAMNFRGRMPWVVAQPYMPSLVEWGISIGLIAATIFLFGLGVRLMPLLPKQEASGSH